MYSKLLFSLFLLLFVCGKITAQNKAIYDSLQKKGTEAYLKSDYIKSLEYYTEARALAEKNHWNKELYNSLMSIGNTYYLMLDYGEAINYLLESYTVAVKQLGPTEEIASLNNIANLYTREKIFDKAIEYYNRAYDIAKEKNIDSRKGLPLMNLGFIYNQLNNPKKARPYIIACMPYLKGQSHEKSTKVLLAENDLLLGDIQKARTQAWDILRSLHDPAKDDLDLFIWPIIAKTYLFENNYAQAAEYAKKPLERNPDLVIKRDIYELLSTIYTKGKNFNDALRFKDSVNIAERKLNDIKNGRLFENNRVRFEIQNYKEQIKAKEEKITAERTIFYSALVIIAAIVIILLLIFRQKKILAERNQHSTELDLEKEKTQNLLLEKQITNALLEQERLKNEVETRNRKLSSKALYLSGKNELIEEIVTYLSKKPKLSKDVTLAAHVQSLKNQLRTDNEWDDFISHFEEVNHGFITRLKALHPTLNTNDIRFIAYTYMNLSSKEIASILNITPVASKKRKERIAAKMEIPKNTDLFDYISAI
jgi:tetratricopeptide (TPR) repeat protein